MRGKVMLVFTLPSYPYVFKVIKDVFGPGKDTDRATVRSKFEMVKHVDRVGRLADTLEFTALALPLERFSPELLAELRDARAVDDRGRRRPASSIHHCYVERRMTPLNIYLDRGDAGGARAGGARSTATRSATSRSRTSSRATCSGGTSASRATAASSSTTTTRSSTSPTSTSAGSRRRRTRRPSSRASRGTASCATTSSRRSSRRSCSATRACASTSSATTPSCSSRSSGRSASAGSRRGRSSTSSRTRSRSGSRIGTMGVAPDHRQRRQTVFVYAIRSPARSSVRWLAEPNVVSAVTSSQPAVAASAIRCATRAVWQPRRRAASRVEALARYATPSRTPSRPTAASRPSTAAT